VKKTICGVDLSKAKLDICIEPGHRLASFNNDTVGIAELAAFCREHAVTLVVMEASGGYERRAFVELWEKGISCALTNPRNVRRYAEAMGILEKTDRIDSSVIARFADAKNLAPTPLPSQAQQRLKALVTRLRQVTDDLTVQKQRRAGLQPGDPGQPRRGDSSLQAPIPLAGGRNRLHDRRRSVVGKARRDLARDQGRCRTHRCPAAR
jgi:transposase